MKIEDKMKRIKELDKKQFLTPEEIEERLKLDEEVELELRDNGVKLDHYKNVEIEKVENPPTPEQTKQKKMTIYEKFIKPRLKGKPITWDEVQQLKLEYMGTRLKRHIAEDKAKIRQAKSDRFSAIFSMVTGRGNEPQTTKKRKKGSGGNSNKDADDIRAILGSNDPRKLEGLTKR